MFCGGCASPLTTDAPFCPACGLARSAADLSFSTRDRYDRSRQLIRRFLIFLPVLGLLALAGVVEVRASLERRERADRYDAAVAAANAHDLLTAEALFFEAGDYSNAPDQLAAVRAQLAAYEAQYDEAMAAISTGDFDRAIALLEPLKTAIPGYGELDAKLAEARAGHSQALLERAREAVSRQDWLAAEGLYRTLVLENPDDPEIASEQAVLLSKTVFAYTVDHRLMLGSPDGGTNQLIVDTVDASWPVWSPDRTRIAFIGPGETDNTRTLYVVNADGSGLIRIADRLMPARPPVWSPAGAQIAFEAVGVNLDGSLRRPTVMVADLTSGSVVDVVDPVQSNGSSPAWSPTGDRLAYVVRALDHVQTSFPAPEAVLRIDNSVIFVRDMTTGQATMVESSLGIEPWRISWSPAGEQLLIYARADGTAFDHGAMFMLDLETDAAIELQPRHADVSQPVWAPDGSAYAYIIGGDTLRIVTQDGSTIEASVNEALAADLTWSPSSDRLIVYALDAGQRAWIATIDGEQVTFEAVTVRFDEGDDRGSPQWSAANPAE